jgi:hypothetical protein
MVKNNWRKNVKVVFHFFFDKQGISPEIRHSKYFVAWVRVENDAMTAHIRNSQRLLFCAASGPSPTIHD